MSSKSVIIDHFDKYASGWHTRLQQHSYAIRLGVVRRMVSWLRPSVVLDIGCGTGDYCRLFDPEKVRYIGYDISPLMVEECRCLHPDYRFEVADAEKIPEPDGSADLVLDIAVIEYYSNPTPHMRELTRVVRSPDGHSEGGSVIIAVPNGSNITKRPIEFTNRIIEQIFSRPHPQQKDILHVPQTLAQMKRLGETVGLKLIDYGYCSLRFVPKADVDVPLSRIASDKPQWCWLSRWAGTILVCHFMKT